MSTVDDFVRAYDALLDHWPVNVTPVDVPTPFGPTRVNVCGPESGAPLLLLPGGGATSTVWIANVAALARSHRVFAVDVMGDVGRSVNDGAPLRTVETLFEWLDAVLDHLGVNASAVVGHSYGAMIALAYALHDPRRVDSLVLLDPTSCFARMNSKYLLRALPVLIRPTETRQRSLIDWETGGAGVDPRWLGVAALGTAAFGRTTLVVPPRPKPDALERLTAHTAVVLAGSSRAHDPGKVAANVRRLLPAATVTTIPAATHHALPMAPAADVTAAILAAVG
ncbi:pimeloyl-ACP methyl ester carboxylesterase [Rhodococcus wratislaviensis]|uniref:Hydrolase n=1 Tax=Rhodococcus wratislaviensis TaxID=44752 RepID=A0AB38FAK1_RHOWR|nr:alpha/beta fold hydrolase [Rhodococcus wratislaviensis]REE71972.1 pimeloyl-ACP methyl ester carboxylesterase [Rhodococcus wratislaviensis]SPZ38536.1 hydrolase [Rhodococcus wratislaviensis]